MADDARNETVEELLLRLDTSATGLSSSEAERRFLAFAEGYRSSGFKAADERELTLVGFLTFADHLLDGTRDSIKRLCSDGVEIKILTGDNELVTRHICQIVKAKVMRRLNARAFEN